MGEAAEVSVVSIQKVIDSFSSFLLIPITTMDLMDPSIMSPMAIKALRITFLMVINQDQTIIMTMDHVKIAVACDVDADVDVEVDDDPQNRARVKMLKIIKVLKIKMTNKIKMINRTNYNNNNNNSQVAPNLIPMATSAVKI